MFKKQNNFHPFLIVKKLQNVVTELSLRIHLSVLCSHISDGSRQPTIWQTNFLVNLLQSVLAQALLEPRVNAFILCFIWGCSSITVKKSWNCVYFLKAVTWTNNLTISWLWYGVLLAMFGHSVWVFRLILFF